MTATDLKTAVLAELVTDEARKEHEAKVEEAIAEFVAKGYPAAGLKRLDQLRPRLQFWGLSGLWLDSRIEALEVRADLTTVALEQTSFSDWPYDRLYRWRLAEVLEAAERRAEEAEAQAAKSQSETKGDEE